MEVKRNQENMKKDLYKKLRFVHGKLRIYLECTWKIQKFKTRKLIDKGNAKRRLFCTFKTGSLNWHF